MFLSGLPPDIPGYLHGRFAVLSGLPPDIRSWLTLSPEGAEESSAGIAAAPELWASFGRLHEDKALAAEAMLRDSLIAHANELSSDQHIMLKLTLPEEDNFYADLIADPQVVRVVALSGGYSREEANARLTRNNGMIASFSRALSQGLSAQQSEDDFTSTLDATVQSIRDASAT